MRRRLAVRIILAVAVAGFAWAQDNRARISIPSMGLAFDSDAGGLRAIEGTPGAAQLGQILPEGARLAFAAVLPGGKAAIGVDVESGAVVLISGGERRELPGAIAGPAAIRGGPGGTSAALLYSDGTVQVFTELDRGGILHWQFRREGRLASGIVASVSGEGNELALAEGEALHLLRRSGEESRLTPGGEISFVDFGAGGRLLAASAQSGKVWEIQGGEARPLAEGADGVVAAAGSGDQLALAYAGGRISILAGGGAAPVELNCACEPKSLQRLGSGLYQLTGPESGTAWILDPGTAGAPPRLLFAAGRIASAAGVEQ